MSLLELEPSVLKGGQKREYIATTTGDNQEDARSFGYGSFGNSALVMRVHAANHNWRSSALRVRILLGAKPCTKSFCEA